MGSEGTVLPSDRKRGVAGRSKISAVTGLNGYVVGVTGVVGEEFTVTLEGPGRYETDPFRFATGHIIKDEELNSEYTAIVTFASVGIKGLGFDAEGLYHFVLRQGDQVIHKAPVGVFVSSKKEGDSEHDSANGN